MRVTAFCVFCDIPDAQEAIGIEHVRGAAAELDDMAASCPGNRDRGYAAGAARNECQPATNNRSRGAKPPADPGEWLAARAGVLLLPALLRGACGGRHGSGYLSWVRAAPAARHLCRDGGAPGTGVCVFRRPAVRATCVLPTRRARPVDSSMPSAPSVSCRACFNRAGPPWARRGGAGRLDGAILEHGPGLPTCCASDGDGAVVARWPPPNVRLVEVEWQLRNGCSWRRYGCPAVAVHRDYSPTLDRRAAG